jgi:hypothetical protein
MRLPWQYQKTNMFFKNWNATAASAKACAVTQSDKDYKDLLTNVQNKIKTAQELLARHASPGISDSSQVLKQVTFHLPSDGFRSVGLDIHKRVMVHYVGKKGREARYDGSQFLAVILYGLMSFAANMAYT